MINWKYNEWKSYKPVPYPKYIADRDKALIEALREIAEGLKELIEVEKVK